MKEWSRGKKGKKRNELDKDNTEPVNQRHYHGRKGGVHDTGKVMFVSVVTKPTCSATEEGVRVRDGKVVLYPCGIWTKYERAVKKKGIVKGDPRWEACNK